MRPWKGLINLSDLMRCPWLRVLLEDRRAMDPARFAHLRRDLGLDAPDDAPAR